MGNADSKIAADDNESVVVHSVNSKGSQVSEYSYDGEKPSGNNGRTKSKKQRENGVSRMKNGSRNGGSGTGNVNVTTPADPEGASGNIQQSRDDEDVNNSGEVVKPIADEQINVNLAMADLMAYLQVVANNSNHLPLTRRDDPELDRTLSTLSAEDYARKSAAFVPADVRVIGGTFTRYGRVWDLPTSEEYNACDGAHEPGRSYGGACTNSLLKVVYDAVNDVAGGAQAQAASQALFDDDDDEDESTLGKSLKSGFSLEASNPNPSTITWAHMLRQMKAEFKDVGYAQVPKITTTRRIDLNKAFSLVADDFDPIMGKKRSLLIGCNYRNMEGAELKASHDDIRSMKDYIVNVHGFSESPHLMTVLLDDDDHKHPTFMNIIEAFKVLSEESQPGDAVFVQFSGHGGRVLDSPVDSEAESYDEMIVPSDYGGYGLIRDTLIFKTLLAPMRYGVTVTVMIDCCDNGMVMELPYSWSPKAEKKDTLAKLSTNEDFSFVRFLKVVKTLYESSTFTQLGRTVNSALPPMPEKPKNDLGKLDTAEPQQDDNAVPTEPIGRASGSIFDALTEACSPTKGEDRPKSKDLGKATSDETGDKQTSLIRESLLEKVMNCTLLGPPEDDFSDDEDTFKTRTEDDHSFDNYTDNGDSFDSLTEEENSRKIRSKHKRRS